MTVDVSLKILSLRMSLSAAVDGPELTPLRIPVGRHHAVTYAAVDRRDLVRVGDTSDLREHLVACGVVRLLGYVDDRIGHRVRAHIRYDLALSPIVGYWYQRTPELEHLLADLGLWWRPFRTAP